MAVTPWRARAQCRRAKEDRKKGSTIYKAVFFTPNDRNKFPNSPKSIEIPPVAVRSKACMEKELFKRSAGEKRNSNMIREIKIIKDNTGGTDEQADILDLFSSILPKVQEFNLRQLSAPANSLKVSKPSELARGGRKTVLVRSELQATSELGIGAQWDRVVNDQARMLEMHAF